MQQLKSFGHGRIILSHDIFDDMKKCCLDKVLFRGEAWIVEEVETLLQLAWDITW